MDQHNEFTSLLPIVMRIASKTISQDLYFASEEEINAVKHRIKSENRDCFIESVIGGQEFNEKKLEDDPEYIELSKKGVFPMNEPKASIFFFDNKYDKK